MGIYQKSRTFPRCHLRFSPKASPCPWSQGVSIVVGHAKHCLSRISYFSCLPSPEGRMFTHIWEPGGIWFQGENNAASKYVLKAYLFIPTFGSFMKMQPWFSYLPTVKMLMQILLLIWEGLIHKHSLWVLANLTQAYPLSHGRHLNCIWKFT